MNTCPKLNWKVRLQKKEYRDDGLGGRFLEWVYTDANEYWADIQPAAERYPIVYKDQKYWNPKVYDVIMEDSPMIHDSNKIIWKQSIIDSLAESTKENAEQETEQELLYLCTPQKYKYKVPGRITYIQIRVLSWKQSLPKLNNKV